MKKRERMTMEEKAARVRERGMAKIAADRLKVLDVMRRQKAVKELTITLEWYRARTGERNVRADYSAVLWDGGRVRGTGYKADGYGYDKASTMVADIFGDTLAYKLFEDGRDWENKPYGVVRRLNEEGGLEWQYFEGGIGIDCYWQIGEWLGGEFELVASGKNFDVYRWVDKRGREGEG